MRRSPPKPPKAAPRARKAAKALQSALAAAMETGRAFYGKGGPGKGVVQKGLFPLPDGRLVEAKALPEARTPRARLMGMAREWAMYAMRNLGEPTVDLEFIVENLADGIARMEAETAGDKTTFDAALLRMWCLPNFGANCATFAKTWEARIRQAWREYEVNEEVRLPEEHPAPDRTATEPADDPKLMRELLADALDVVGVHRPESNDWIKGLPIEGSKVVSVLVDFVVERTRWDATAETSKAALYADYVQWLEAAKVAHPERYGDAEKPTLKVFCREVNLSLTVQDARPERKGEARPRTWKGIRLLPPTSEPAGDVAIRREPHLAEALRQALVMPSK